LVEMELIDATAESDAPAQSDEQDDENTETSSADTL